MKLFKKIKEFFSQPDQMDLIEERFLKRLEDMKQNPSKYAHLSNSSNTNKIPPVSLF